MQATESTNTVVSPFYGKGSSDGAKLPSASSQIFSVSLICVFYYCHCCRRPFSDGPLTFFRIIVDVFMIVYQLGICCVYIVFVATNIKSVADYYVKPLDVRLYMLMLLLPLILINYIRNLKRLAPLSTLANVITFVGLGIVLYYIFDNLPSIDSVDYVGPLKGYPLYVGTTLFALEAVGVVSNMKIKIKCVNGRLCSNTMLLCS